MEGDPTENSSGLAITVKGREGWGKLAVQTSELYASALDILRKAHAETKLVIP